MESIYFLTIWIGCSLLHTLYDLKVKPYLEMNREKSNNWPYV